MYNWALPEIEIQTLKDQEGASWVHIIRQYMRNS